MGAKKGMALVFKYKQREKDRPKPKVSLAEHEAEARRLGLSFGMYMAYLESGYLPTYRKWFEEQLIKKIISSEKVNVIESKIIGG